MDSWKFRYSIFYRTLKGGLNWEYVNRLGETIEIFLLFSFSWPVPFFLIFRECKVRWQKHEATNVYDGQMVSYRHVVLLVPRVSQIHLLCFVDFFRTACNIFVFTPEIWKKKKKVIDQNRLGIHYTNGSSPPMMPGHRLNMFLWEPIGPMRHDGWQKSK